MWNDFWRNNGGEYQITTIDKSFNDSEIIDVIKDEVAYRKVNIKEISEIKNVISLNKIKQLPALCLIKNGDLLINYQGQCDINYKKQLIDMFNNKNKKSFNYKLIQTILYNV